MILFQLNLFAIHAAEEENDVIPIPGHAFVKMDLFDTEENADVSKMKLYLTNDNLCLISDHLSSRDH